MRATIVRAGIAILAAFNAWWGGWAIVAPREFFDSFPGFGHHWTAAYPPYNQHLVTDLGATFVTLAFLLGVAAVVNQRSVRAVVLGGVLVFNSVHLTFHLVHHEDMAPVDAWASLATLAAGVLGPAVLLVLDAVTPRRTRSPRDQPS